MSSFVFDLQDYHERIFGTKPKISEETARMAEDSSAIRISSKPDSDIFSSKGSRLRENYKGKEIWMPIRMVNLDEAVFGVTEIFFAYCTLKISGSSDIVRTKMANRIGTVKELYAAGDYHIDIRGYLIGYDENGHPKWPETEIEQVKKLSQLGEAFELDNALTDLFLEGKKVVVTAFDLGYPNKGQTNVQVFTMKLESDSVFSLTVS